MWLRILGLVNALFEFSCVVFGFGCLGTLQIGCCLVCVLVVASGFLLYRLVYVGFCLFWVALACLICGLLGGLLLLTY